MEFNMFTITNLYVRFEKCVFLTFTMEVCCSYDKYSHLNFVFLPQEIVLSFNCINILKKGDLLVHPDITLKSFFL